MNNQTINTVLCNRCGIRGSDMNLADGTPVCAWDATMEETLHAGPATFIGPRTLDWAMLGRELRASAGDAHEGNTPSLDFAYSFLLDNPECFGYEEWPADMPAVAPEELQRTYGMVTK